MRTDVKLGMAIGGLLLVIVVVYVTFSPPNKAKNGHVEMATSDEAGANDAFAGPQQPKDSAAGEQGAKDRTRDARAGRNAPPSGNPPARNAGNTPNPAGAGPRDRN